MKTTLTSILLSAGMSTAQVSTYCGTLEKYDFDIKPKSAAYTLHCWDVDQDSLTDVVVHYVNAKQEQIVFFKHQQIAVSRNAYQRLCKGKNYPHCDHDKDGDIDLLIKSSDDDVYDLYEHTASSVIAVNNNLTIQLVLPDEKRDLDVLYKKLINERTAYEQKLQESWVEFRKQKQQQ